MIMYVIFAEMIMAQLLEGVMDKPNRVILISFICFPIASTAPKYWPKNY